MASMYTGPSLNWQKCIFCQKESWSKTVCAADSKRTDIGCGYRTLSEAVDSLRTIGKLLASLNMDIWDEGAGIENTCKERKARWYSQCREILHPTAVARLNKRALLTTEIGNVEQQNTNADISEICLDADVSETSSKVARLTCSVSSSKCTDFTMLCFFVKLRAQKICAKLPQLNFMTVCDEVLNSER